MHIRLLAGRPAARGDEPGYRTTASPQPSTRDGGGRSRVAALLRARTPSERASIRIWDVAQATEVRRLAVEGAHAEQRHISPDGKILAAPFCDATIRFYDPASGNELGRIKVNGPMQGALVFSPDGRSLASGDNPETGPATATSRRSTSGTSLAGRKFGAFRLEMSSASGIAFSPDGKKLASTVGKMIHLWEAETGREINTAPSHRSSVACLVVSPADGSVITGGYDNAIRKWDPATGRELAVIGSHPRPVYDMAISPDGRSLLSSSIDATIHLRDLGAGQDLPRVLVGNPQSRGEGWPSRPTADSPPRRARSGRSPRDWSTPRFWTSRASRSGLGAGPASRPTARDW